MPPKPKFTKEEVVKAALKLISESGIDALTSRGLGKYLGCSACPIFTMFKDMDELKNEVYKAAKALFDSYMSVSENYNPAYKKRGMQWIKFAQENPRLFQMLFMSETGSGMDFEHAIQAVPFSKDADLAIIMRDYHATKQQAEHLFGQMWIYTYGLCTLCATGVCSFTEEEITIRLGEIFQGMIFVIRSKSEGVTGIKPVESNSFSSENISKHHPALSKNI